MNINCKNIQGSFLFAISIRKKEDLYILLCVVRCLCSGLAIGHYLEDKESKRGIQVVKGRRL